MSISNSCLYSCYLRSDVNQFTYEYSVDNIRERNHNLIKSSVFHAEDSSWTVIVAPIVKNITDGYEYLGLFLNRESGDKALWAKYTFALLNVSTGQRFNVKTGCHFFTHSNNITTNKSNTSLITNNGNNSQSNTNTSAALRQRSSDQRWSQFFSADSVALNSAQNYDILRFEFSPPLPGQASNSLQGSRTGDPNRSPVQLINGKSSGIKSFITREALFNLSNHLVENNKITVVCDIYLFTINDPLETLERFDLNLSENYSDLLKEGKYSDVKLIVDGTELPAHKSILSARSPVFNAMFSSDMSENRENIIRIDDLTKEVIEELLNFIYSGKVTNLSKVSKELLSAADKYELPQLSDLCEQYLTSSLNVESAPEILVLSHLHKAVKLKSVSIEFIINNRKDVMKSENWELIRREPDLMEELFKALSNQFDKFGVFVN
ncbi:speckle-type POZ protein-like [Oppia nitens]|uniref:speckle-type POZ protein-like n=1 Tax=Oppia nitens TaxID=1686743 RepID=UPI0023D9DF8C|nr:speckle-type POZ protein-like [Oppia nitens]